MLLQSWDVWTYLVITVLCVSGGVEHCRLFYFLEEILETIAISTLGCVFQWLMVGRMRLAPAGFPNWNVGFSELLKLLRYCVSLDLVQAVPSTLTALTEYFLSLISLDRWHAKPKLELLQDISLSAVSLVCPFICCAGRKKVKIKKALLNRCAK